MTTRREKIIINRTNIDFTIIAEKSYKKYALTRLCGN